MRRRSTGGERSRSKQLAVLIINKMKDILQVYTTPATAVTAASKKEEYINKMLLLLLVQQVPGTTSLDAGFEDDDDDTQRRTIQSHLGAGFYLCTPCSARRQIDFM